MDGVTDVWCLCSVMSSVCIMCISWRRKETQREERKADAWKPRGPQRIQTTRTTCSQERCVFILGSSQRCWGSLQGCGGVTPLRALAFFGVQGEEEVGSDVTDTPGYGASLLSIFPRQLAGQTPASHALPSPSRFTSNLLETDAAQLETTGLLQS